jgi:hypothetical protein
MAREQTSVLIYIEESWPPDVALEKSPYMSRSTQRVNVLHMSYQCRSWKRCA